MGKQFFRRFGALCTSAVLACGSLLSVNSTTANAADDNYARLLQYSLYFYDANMCGKDVSSKTAVSWRGNCHTDDAVPGGYHDAGDHAMFGLPQGYTATALGLSYYEFKDAYTKTGQGDHLKVILDHFCTFFKNSTQLNGDNVSRFLYQKGNGKTDHGYWGAPEKQGSRADQMYWTSNGASDIAANYASALALNYKNFGNAEDLKYAKALYNFAKQYKQCATDGPGGFYDSKFCGDELAMAAGCLAFATGDNGYKQELKDGLNSFDIGWAYGWNDAHLGAAVMNGIVNGDWSKATGYIGSKCNGSGYFFMDKWGSARLNCSMQFMALVLTKEKQGNYTDWAKGQMNYILGANPSNTCFVTGYASNSAKNAHHRGASGYSAYGFNKSGKDWTDAGDHMDPYAAYDPTNGKTLVGALVGGPCTANGDYHDNLLDYVCNEVAIDYNAGLVGSAAGLYVLTNCTGKIDSTINGITKIYNASSQPQQTDAPPVQTDAPQTQAPVVTQAPQTQAPSDSGDGYTITPKTKYVWSETDDDHRMIEWPWSDFKIKNGEVATKVEFNISTTKSSIGTWQGNFGTGTSEAPEYWYMPAKDSSKSFTGNTGTITWEIPSDVAKIINYSRDDCPLKLGIWWVDSDEITVDSIKVYTSGSTTPVQTQAPVVTTAAPQTKAPVVTTAAPQTQAPQTQAPVVTTAAPQTQAPQTQAPQVQANKWGDADCNGYVDVSDAVIVAKISAGLDDVVISDTGVANADVSHNNKIDSADVTKILQYIVGMLQEADLAK